MGLKFVKMHGIGNDYLYLDAVTEPTIEELIDQTDFASKVARMSDRHKGVGSDGLIFVCRPIHAENHVRMRMFNADGSESEMCGNGVRCVAKFAHDRLGIRPAVMRVETGRGVLEIGYEVEGGEEGKLNRANVNMGEPVLELGRVPVDVKRLVLIGGKDHSYGLEMEGKVWEMAFVSMGNPHAIAFVESVDAIELERIGPKVEKHGAFPNRVNFHVVELGKDDRCSQSEMMGFSSGQLGRAAKSVRMRSWERGSGITLACGTGACAVYVAGVLTGRIDPAAAGGVQVELPGGELRISAMNVGACSQQAQSGSWGWGEIVMSGPAEDICEGIWLG